MHIRDKIGLDCLSLDPIEILGKPEPDAANYCFELCANILRDTGILSSRLFVVTNKALLIADMGTILHSELGIRAAEEITEDLCYDQTVAGLGVAHALAFNEAKNYCVLADRSDILENTSLSLVTHFEWRHGLGAGKRANYILDSGKAKFFNVEQVNPKKRYLFLEGICETVH